MGKMITFGSFVWDEHKASENKRLHGLDFADAMQAFLDTHRVIAIDALHSRLEPRMFCIGKVKGRIATVRFTCRGRLIRIIGAGFWRKGRRLYEKTQKEAGR